MFVKRVSCTKTAERIEVLFGVETQRDPKLVVLDGDLGFLMGYFSKCELQLNIITSGKVVNTVLCTE